MTDPPLLSFIVRSHDYADYIGTTIQSILDQTVQDFEVIVVDDASHDASVEIVRSFGDPRIRLLINERNLGGPASHNRGVEAASGEWLVNVDADDWIAPTKTEAQLAAAAADPAADIVGTWVCCVDAQGQPHPQAVEVEAHFNRSIDLQSIGSWIGTNHLANSSTMVRRAAQLRVGLDDATLSRAHDYERWTRAVRAGCRFHVVAEKLTYLRMHPRSITLGRSSSRGSVGSLLEMTYAMLRNLLPYVEANAPVPSLQQMVSWVAHHPDLSTLSPTEADRLVGCLLTSPRAADFAVFGAVLAAGDSDPVLTTVGRRVRCLSTAWRDARQFQEQQAHNWEEAYRFQEQQARNWEAAFEELRETVRRQGGQEHGGDAGTCQPR